MWLFLSFVCILWGGMLTVVCVYRSKLIFDAYLFTDFPSEVI